ncbi:Integrase recombinase xerD-like [Paramuricea clavata]|uniref:Integrase recombinase xerD-like n=1 Tax=Paramuricea clavata TaxID=317549 RepID=A0A6S7G1C9_PARCT|nr:Integrase recombinase xerD-like [Paramuricea clavata]
MPTIHSAVYAIAWAHKKAGKKSPTEHTLVKQMIETSRRIVGLKPVNRKQPLEAKHVKAIIVKFGDGNLRQLQIATLITLGFSAFLRWDDLSKLERQDIAMENDHMKIFLVKRKNDQYREGSWILVARPGKISCPVKLLEKFLRMGKHRQQDKLFRKISHTSNGMQPRKSPLSYSRALELFKIQISSIGLNQSAYGLHSLRSGGTSEAAAWGIPDRLIQRHGGWRSEKSMNMSLKRHILSHNTLLRVSQRLGL